MKSQSFPASINRGSKELFISSGYDAIAKNGAFVKIGANEVCYQIESYNVIDIKKKFKSFGDSISIKGDYRERIFSSDFAASTRTNVFSSVSVSTLIRGVTAGAPIFITVFHFSAVISSSIVASALTLNANTKIYNTKKRAAK